MKKVKRSRDKFIVYDLPSLLGYFTYRTLSNHYDYRHYTFCEFDNFVKLVCEMARKNKQTLNILENDSYRLNAAIKEHSDYFLPYISNDGYSGFSVQYGISASDLFNKFCCSFSCDSIYLLDQAFREYTIIFLLKRDKALQE